MSLAKLVFPQLAWAELEHLLLFLEWRDQWLLASTNRSAFIAFLRCRSIRECQKYKTSPPTTRFLSKLSGHDRVLLVSYPRCGNSFFRKLIEEHTNIVTGSDSRPNRTLSASLLRFGYRGEGITDSSVWLVKSHFPERLGYIRLNVKRVILLVRNPFDALESYFHMGFTNTHNKRLTEQVLTSLDFVVELQHTFEQ